MIVPIQEKGRAQLVTLGEIRFGRRRCTRAANGITLPPDQQSPDCENDRPRYSLSHDHGISIRLGVANRARFRTPTGMVPCFGRRHGRIRHFDTESIYLLPGQRG